MNETIQNILYDINNHKHRLEGFIVGNDRYKITKLYLKKSKEFSVKLNLDLNDHLRFIKESVLFNLCNNFNFSN
jgi:hypothetical protein